MLTWIHSFFSLLFPRYCVVCHHSLSHSEECLCTACNIQMPRTNYHLQKDNPAEKLFWAQIPIERATCFFHYHKGNDFCRIVQDMKYKGRKHIGEAMGRYMATEIRASGFFDDIDIIMPIPLHRRKLRERGYNQSEWIARGIASVTKLPVDTVAVSRKVYTSSQTNQSVFERWENVKDAFTVNHPEKYAGKHILLVDDVLTTGSTIVACASTFSKIENIRFSVVTLGTSR